MGTLTRAELLQIADARLHPSLRNPNYLVLHSRREIFTSYLRALAHNLTVLDVGGRYQPYRPLREGKATKYIALDLQTTELGVELQCDCRQMNTFVVFI